MDRLEFLKLTMMAATASTVSPSVLSAEIAAKRKDVPERNRTDVYSPLSTKNGAFSSENAPLICFFTR